MVFYGVKIAIFFIDLLLPIMYLMLTSMKIQMILTYLNPIQTCECLAIIIKIIHITDNIVLFPFIYGDILS